MTIDVPAVDDTIIVVDQTSEYRNKPGTVTQALGGSPVAFMVTLMEHWVEKLNKQAKPLLTKAVTCIDCHDTDPRR